MSKAKGLTLEEIVYHANECCEAMYAGGRQYVDSHDLEGLDLMIVVMAARRLAQNCDSILQSRVDDARAKQN